MSRCLTLVISALILLAGGQAQAQYRYYSNNYGYSSPHYHDAAGHRIDAMGHHIDLSGHHTGNVGVYDNGQADFGRTYYTPRYDIYYQPQQPNVIRSSAVPQNTVQALRPVVARTGEPIIICLPKNSTQEVNYAVNGFVYTIQPSFEQKLIDDRQWTIAFGSGGTNGDVRYTLSPGRYNFQLTDGGWDLVREKEAVPENLAPPPPPMARP